MQQGEALRDGASIGAAADDDGAGEALFRDFS
jgi:hypothetical protein